MQLAFRRFPAGGTAEQSSGDRERAESTLLRCFIDAVGADSGAIVARGGSEGSTTSLRDLLAESGDVYGPRVISTWSRERRPMPLSWLNGGILDRGLHADRPLVEVDYERPRLSGNGHASNGHTSDDGVVAPIRLGARPVGVLYASFSSAPAMEPAEIAWIAEAFASAAALCLDDHGGLAATLRASGFDGLTGCLSAGSLLDALDAEIARSRRYRHRLSCCFVDLDGFKQVNDRYGHLEGNQVLADVAVALRSVARGYDSIGRFGGDEFVAVLPQTNLRGAVRVAERMVDAVGAVHEPSLPAISASVGVCEWDDAMSAAATVETADRALRRAKEAGGGAVAAARAPATPLWLIRSRGARGARR